MNEKADERNKRVPCVSWSFIQGIVFAAFNQHPARAIRETMSTSRLRESREREREREGKQEGFRSTRVPSILHK